MRKIKLTLLAAIVAVSFAACGEKKATTENTEENTTQTEEPAPAPTLSEEDQFIADYEKFVNDGIAIMEKVKGGDAAAMEEYQKLSEAALEFSNKSQEMMTKLNEEQIKKMSDIGMKYAEAAQKMMGQ